MKSLKDKMDPRIEELLPFYALDALTDEEREQVDTYLRAHPEARKQLEELGRTASALPYGTAPVEPAPRTKRALMARIGVDARAGERASQADQPARRVRRFEGLFQWLSLGAAVAAILWAVVLNIQLTQLRNDVSLMGEALAVQSNALEQINAKLPQTPRADTVTIALKGTDVRPQAQGQLIADPSSQSAVLVISGLAELEPGKTYQVWLIDGGGPQSAGLLTVDSHGQAFLIVTSDLTIGSFNALGISVEPVGGSTQPTGDIVVLSDL